MEREQCISASVGGYLVERWVQGCAAQIQCLFGLSGLPMVPFLLGKWLRCIGCIFAKCLIFDKFVVWFTYTLSKSMHPNLHGKKVLSGLKRCPSRNKWFRLRHMLQICILSGLVRVVVKILGQTFVPRVSVVDLRGNSFFFCIFNIALIF